MKILIINSQTAWKGENGFQVLTHRNFNDHLGVRYVASSLEQGGHTVDIIDAHFEEISFAEVLSRISSTQYDVYGISFVEAIVEETLEVINCIKESNPESKIFVGGYGATLIGDKVLPQCLDIDAAVVGEGEISTLELVNNINDKASWSGIKGIMFMQEGNLVKTETRPLIRDLDSIPWPKRAEEYKYGRANITASRGCYGACIYCSISEFYARFEGKQVRVRDPYKVVDEMEYVSKKYGVKYFDFVDDNFTCTCRNDFEWAIKFTDEIRRRDLKITWGIQARANDINEELFRILYKGGLRVVSIGIENDVERVIKFFKTGTTKQIHRRVVEILRKIRLDMYIEMILLEPTTTLEEIRENLDFLTEIKFPEVYRQNPVTFTTKLHLYTGTSVVEKMKSEVDVWQDGYHIGYTFKDARVEKVSDALKVWQERTEELASLQLSYLQYEATKKGYIGLGMKIIKLSKKYLAFDIDFYKKLIDFVIEAPDFSQMELESFMKQFDDEIESLKSEFNHVKNTILSA